MVKKTKTSAVRKTKEDKKLENLEKLVNVHRAYSVSLLDQIKELNHQIVSYKAVISYLEFQVGLKDSQGGCQE